jgi:hypothetical protein
VRFTCEGFDEMDPAFGAGSAKLAPDETLIPSALAADSDVIPPVRRA